MLNSYWPGVFLMRQRQTVYPQIMTPQNAAFHLWLFINNPGFFYTWLKRVRTEVLTGMFHFYLHVRDIHESCSVMVKRSFLIIYIRSGSININRLPGTSLKYKLIHLISKYLHITSKE